MATQNQSNQIKIPRKVSADIKDMVDPIVVRRRTILKTAVVIFALAIGVTGGWFLLFAPPSGEALLADAVEAAGGMDAWYNVTEGAYVRTHNTFGPNGQVLISTPSTYYFNKEKGLKLVIETPTGEGLVRIGFNGKEYWATRDGQPIEPEFIARELEMMCESEHCTPTCNAEMAFYRFSMPFKLTDPGAIPKYIGEATLNGKPVHLLEITFAEGVGKDRWVCFVDKENNLIYKIQHFPRKDSDAPPEEIYWSNHQSVTGVTFSHRNSYYLSNGKKFEEYVISEADFETPLPDGLFNGSGSSGSLVQN